jgi:hypothetical protein
VDKWRKLEKARARSEKALDAYMEAACDMETARLKTQQAWDAFKEAERDKRAAWDDAWELTTKQDGK